jgi:cytochrome P450
MFRPANGVPVYQHDIYANDAIMDPHPHYTRLRRLGPVVWLSRQRVYALPRYSECKAVLRDDETFVSGRGVALNPIANRLSRGTTLNSDGAEHDQRRKLLAHRMLPCALRAISDVVDGMAAEVVDAAWLGMRSTVWRTLRRRCRWPWCLTWSVGRATSETISWPGAQPRSTSSAR